MRGVWVLVRLVVIAVITTSLLVVPTTSANVDWAAAISIGILPAVALYVWLSAVRHRSYIDWSRPYSFKHSFLPMNRFPLRYWFVVSYSLLIGGIFVMIRDFFERNGGEAFGGLFFFMGPFLGIALNLWTRKFSRGASALSHND